MTRPTAEEVAKRSAQNRKRWSTPAPVSAIMRDWKPKKSPTLRRGGRGDVGRLELSLPWPPSVNNYWRRNKGPGMHISAKGKEFRSRVMALCAVVGNVPGLLAVQITAYPPDGRARDLDNICKALLDALQHGGAIESDAMIDDLHITRSERVAGGRVDVVIVAIK